MDITIINGPNLNLLGVREKEIYGSLDFDTYLDHLKRSYPEINLSFHQSNIEGEIIDLLHNYGFKSDGILLNAGGYTHTSVAIADAVAAISTPVLEVHISNIYARETERKTSLLSSYCKGSITGLGLDGYELGILWFLKRSDKK